MNYHIVVSPKDILAICLLIFGIIAILIYLLKLIIEDWFKRFKKRKRRKILE